MSHEMRLGVPQSAIGNLPKLGHSLRTHFKQTPNFDLPLQRASRNPVSKPIVSFRDRQI